MPAERCMICVRISWVVAGFGCFGYVQHWDPSLACHVSMGLSENWLCCYHPKICDSWPVGLHKDISWYLLVPSVQTPPNGLSTQGSAWVLRSFWVAMDPELQICFWTRANPTRRSLIGIIYIQHYSTNSKYTKYGSRFATLDVDHSTSLFWPPRLKLGTAA